MGTRNFFALLVFLKPPTSPTPSCSGQPRREFLQVDDMAAASFFVLDLDKRFYDMETEPMLSHINVGTRNDISIADLARLIADVTGCVDTAGTGAARHL